MISLQEAQKMIERTVGELPSRKIRLSGITGCMLTEEIVASINVPDFPSSAMDGVAVRFDDLKGDGPWRLPIQRIIEAGNADQDALAPGEAVKIMTGAPMPDGADTVIPVELVSLESGHAILKDRPEKGQYARPSGNDIRKGQILFKKGKVLSPIDVSILALLGLTAVKVVPRPKIALISTGSEIVKPGRKLQRGQIYDSNYAFLRSMLIHDGHRLNEGRRMIEDEPGVISRALEESGEENDLIITTGAVSAGDFDFIPREIERLGGEVIFHEVKIKPGKPVLLARLDKSWLVGLPGSPGSVVVCYHLFARGVISRLMGIPYKPKSLTARLGGDLMVRGDGCMIIGARFEKTSDGVVAYPTSGRISNRLSSLKGIDGFIQLEGGPRTVAAGSEVYGEWLY
jgi:molybdopterin molybdotransferase